MIAPIRETEEPPQSSSMRRAHRLVVSTLLREQDRSPEIGAPVAFWHAWLFVAWVVVATGIYAGYLFGLFS